MTNQPMPIISDRRILEAETPARHLAIVRYANGQKGMIEVWSIDHSAVAVFGLLQQARQSLGEFKFLGLKKVEVEA